jgi:hypothetical protein
MKIQNIHERVIGGDAAAVGSLLDRLSSEDDRLWPGEDWAPMRFDRPLGVGATGGHGPIAYSVVAYEPSRRITFAFEPGEATRGFDGTHTFEAIPDENGVRLVHRIDMEVSFGAALRWYLVIEPLHDALLEDAFDRAEGRPKRRYDLRVRALRWWMKRKSGKGDDLGTPARAG